MTDTPTPTPEAVAAIMPDVIRYRLSHGIMSGSTKGPYVRYDDYEALAADRDAQKALADAAEERLRDWQANQHYRYIGRDGKTVLASDLEARAEAAEAKAAKLVEAATARTNAINTFLAEWENELPMEAVSDLHRVSAGIWADDLEERIAALRGEVQG